MSLEDIRDERIRKFESLNQKGIYPYPASLERTHTIATVLKRFSGLAESKKSVAVVGRLMSRREHGGAVFFDVEDGSSRIQAYARHNALGDAFSLFGEAADIGDFLEIKGTAFETKKGEKTIDVTEWRMLAKSLLPLPEKWHGLQDIEERFRKRYLDLLMNETVRERFEIRSRIIQALRAFHEERGFLEVETPMLHPIPGGALARPFVTHHNALDTDFYLRVAPELYLKRLLVGGWERVYEIGKSFRNEGIDAAHNPEFTELESYAAYWDEEDMMKFVEELFVSLAKTFGKNQTVQHQEQEITFKKPFSRVPFKELLARYALVSDYERETSQSLAVRAKQLGLELDPNQAKGKIADEIYKKICRPYVIQPTFLTHHPLDISPLAKKREEKPDEVRRFQLLAGGAELANAFSELNDPIDQRGRFEEQERERSQGDQEAHRIDEEYIEAMEYGMPPAAGLGIGVDRLVMLFTDTKNIREVVLFPTLRPK
ncbi:MAG: lysine--tRNA ligase [Candidatus Sungbacteria bacterium]|nr:lysine--tRNA ligase [Candidatus Sungbacteria bacterium]